MTSIRDRAADGLKASMLARDRDAVAAYRQVLSAFSNAEAVPSTARAGAIEAASTAGSRDVEAERRVLSEEELRRLATAEFDDAVGAAIEATGLGAGEQAARLRRQADLIAGLLAEQ